MIDVQCSQSLIAYLLHCARQHPDALAREAMERVELSFGFGECDVHLSTDESDAIARVLDCTHSVDGSLSRELQALTAACSEAHRTRKWLRVGVAA
jgi:hypothetical protein